MAGDFEEPFRINFQADSLHSGSISFGRFAKEDLCWERRSSFSHNKYLEEVEKYSKPGSVTEKKAILEAHFKRRALLSRSSSESHSGIECQSSGNDLSENNHFERDYENVNDADHYENVNDAGHYENVNDAGHYENVNDAGHYENVNDVGHYENVNDVGHSSHFGVTESTGYEGDFEHFNDYGSVYDNEHESTECDREDCGFGYFEPQSNHDDSVGIISEHFQDEERCSVTATVTVDPESEIHAEEKHGDEASGANVRSDVNVPVPTSHKINKDGSASSEPRQKSSPKVRSSASQTKHMKSRSSPVNAAKANSVVSKEAAKCLTRKPRTKSDISAAEKPISHSNAAPTYCSMSRTPKHEVSSSSKSKAHKESKSTEKETRTREKAVHNVHQTPYRHKNTAAASTTPSMRQHCSAFSFKSEERAERRKEFSMKLEEKMHAKEAEMHQLQTRRQEKSEAEIRRLRRSLNFKATPMPSFYQEAGQKSDRNKKVETKRPESSKAQRKHSSPSTAAAENDTSSSGVTTETRAGKNEREKKQPMSSRKPKTPEINKVNRSPKVEEKPRISARRSSNNLIRKGIKGVHLGSNSRLDCLAVGVAS